MCLLAPQQSVGKRVRRVLSAAGLQALLLGLGLVMLVPFVWLVSTSLKVRGTEFTFPPVWIPRPAVWRNYYVAIFASGLPFTRFLMNTAIITGANMVGVLLTASMVGFGFARMRFPGRSAMFMLVVSTLMLPEIVTTIPSYLLFRRLDWIDTFLPLIVPTFLGGGAFNIFLFRQFFMAIPYELDEAARIDGAGVTTIYLRVILPLSRPVLTSVAIFTFLGNWNSFMGPLIYLNSIEKMTLAVGLRAFQGLHGTEWNLDDGGGDDDDDSGARRLLRGPALLHAGHSHDRLRRQVAAPPRLRHGGRAASEGPCPRLKECEEEGSVRERSVATEFPQGGPVGRRGRRSRRLRRDAHAASHQGSGDPDRREGSHQGRRRHAASRQRDGGGRSDRAGSGRGGAYLPELCHAVHLPTVQPGRR